MHVNGSQLTATSSSI